LLVNHNKYSSVKVKGRASATQTHAILLLELSLEL
jgi:hypothetical protein